MINEDEKYTSLRKTLGSLPKIKAKNDFEGRLLQRIKETEQGIVHVTVKPKKDSVFAGWLSNLFSPSLVPALGLTMVLLITIIVYFSFFNKMNDTASTDSRQYVGSTNQGDLIIYVKGEHGDTSISNNYPKEYSAVDQVERGKDYMAPTESPTDYFARPEVIQPSDGLIKPDRVSEEQKIEMQRTVDKDSKGVDTKSERKSDDVIMKKESKKEAYPKGEIKSETDESPFNIRDEKKNSKKKVEDNIQQEEKENLKAEEPVKDTGQKEKTEKDSSKLGKSVKDSVKTKAPTINNDSEENQKIEPQIEQK
ncbi:MAG: hypothetical protein IT281_03855 [Ignavibacteria bacterium]|nr:hypothetical protein [Ignavibacteria bacterium]